MKIKDYKCKCGNDDFFFDNKRVHIGIYCSRCGKWLKWADTDERNLRMKSVSVLDKIISEIDDEAEYAYADFDRYKEDILHAESDELPDDDFRYGLRRAIEIINKYKRESEENMRRDEFPIVDKYVQKQVNEVLDKISTEIDQKQYDFMDDKDYDEGIRFGLMLAYQIIDKYKAESEE